MRGPWAVVIAVVVFSGEACASHKYPLEVAQPFCTEGGVLVRTVTYLAYIGSALPGEEVERTAEPNQVHLEGVGFRNENLANLLGLHVAVEYNKESRLEFEGLYGDTLRVSISRDVTDVPEELAHCGLSAALNATVNSVLINASRSLARYPRAGHLMVRVLPGGGLQDSTLVYGRDEIVATRESWEQTR